MCIEYMYERIYKMSTVTFHLYATCPVDVKRFMLETNSRTIVIRAAFRYFNQILYDERVMLPAHLCKPLSSIDAPTNTLRTQECTRTLHPAYGHFVVTRPSLKVETFTEPNMYSALKASPNNSVP